MKRKGDVIGGLTAALIPVPKAMALGALVFAPLGSDFTSLGIVAGLISLFVSNVTAATFGATPIMINAPFSLSSFMLLAALNTIIEQLGGDISSPTLAFTAITFLFLTIFLSGGFQCLFGLLRVGDLAKYIPYPVLAGLLNGSAFLIILSQIKILLGVPKAMSLWEIGLHFSEIQVFTLIVGLTACLAIWGGPKLSKKIPAPIYGLIGGSLVYYLFVLFGFENRLGSVIGNIPSIIPTPRYGIEFFQYFVTEHYWSLMTKLIPFAIGVAAINSLRSLIVCTTGDNLMLKRSNTNKELFGQGCSNMVNGIFGGISTAGSLSGTLANYQYGGRSAFSRAVSGIFSLLVLLLLSPVMAKVPHAVLAGLLITIAIKSFDAWSLGLFSQVKPDWATGNKSTLVNVIIVFAVTVVVISFGILEALGVGIAISIGWFSVRMSKSGIRREFKADTFHSNTKRGKREFELLEKEGDRIRILELEGAIFFGTADKIAAHVENYLQHPIVCVILDIQRITEIDSTGAKIIKQLQKKCHMKKVVLYLSSVVQTKPEIYQEVSHFFTAEEMHDYCLPDLETALSAAEDQLLNSLVGENRYTSEIPIEKIDMFALFSDWEIGAIQKYLTKKTYREQERIFRQGEPGDGVYFIVKGRAIIVQPQWDGNRQRIGTLCPGTSFGEMSLIDWRPRSADVIAERQLVCFHITLEKMKQLTQEHPQLSHKILEGIAKELSARLRIATRVQASLLS